MEALPEDLIEEFLIKLPCKSLWRFKRVSTKWHNLIVSKSFSLSQAQTFKDPNARFFLYDTNPLPQDHISVTPICVSRYPHEFVIGINPNTKLELPPTMAHSNSWKILPLGLGIYCVIDQNAITEFLWNPTTGQTQLLPKSPYSKFQKYHTHHFGRVYFEEEKLCYQVGRFHAFHFDPYYTLDLYSSKTGSWKHTRRAISYCGYNKHSCGVNLNGRAHFLLSPHHEDTYISSFDYETGMFGRIRVPANTGYFEKMRSILTLYDEKFLCLVLSRPTYRKSNNCVDIWVMWDYEDENSWVKQFTVGLGPFRRCATVLGFSSKLQGIVLRRFNRLVLCDCRSSALIECDSIRMDELHIVEQQESLVSIS